jgi:hypothetical protein
LHRGRRIDLQNPAAGQKANSCLIATGCCFSVGLAVRVAQLLDARGDGQRVDVVELQAPVLTPVKELLDRTCISGPRVAVADIGGEEFDEAAAGALADNRGQLLKPGTDQRRWRRQRLGQQDRLLWH